MTGSVARAPRALTVGWRSLRIAVFGGASLVLATGAHTVGGGTLPSPVVLALTAFVLGLVAVPLTMRRCRIRSLLPVLTIEQVAVHFVLASAADPSGCLPAAGPHHAILAGCAPGVPAVSSAGHGWPMWLGHAVAVVTTAWLLARGEQWLWRVADRIARAASPVARALPVAAQPAVTMLPTPVLRRTFAPLPARGPPFRV